MLSARALSRVSVGALLAALWLSACRGAVVDTAPADPVDAAMSDAPGPPWGDAHAGCEPWSLVPIDFERRCVDWEEKVRLPCEDPMCRCGGLSPSIGCIARPVDGGWKAYLIANETSRPPEGFADCPVEVWEELKTMPKCSELDAGADGEGAD